MRTQLVKLVGHDEHTDTGLIVPKGKVSEAGIEYARAYRDVKYYETIFEILARQFEAAKLDEAREGALIQVVDAAIPPERKSGPKRSLIVIAFTGFGFFVSVLIVFLRSALRKMKSDPIDRARLVQLREALSPRQRVRQQVT